MRFVVFFFFTTLELWSHELSFIFVLEYKANFGIVYVIVYKNSLVQPHSRINDAKLSRHLCDLFTLYFRLHLYYRFFSISPALLFFAMTLEWATARVRSSLVLLLRNKFAPIWNSFRTNFIGKSWSKNAWNKKKFRVIRLVQLLLCIRGRIFTL